MKRGILLSIALLIVLAAPSVADEKTPDDKPKPKQSEFVKATTATGELIYLDKTRKTFKIRVTYVTKELNRGAYNALQRAQANLLRYQARRDRNGIARTQVEIAKQTANLYTLKKKTKDYTVQPVDDFQVRLPKPKPMIDEMGNVVTPSKQELAKLRGKDKLFDGQWADLEQGQNVLVQVVRPRKRDPKEVAAPDVVLSDKVVILSGL